MSFYPFESIRSTSDICTTSAAVESSENGADDALKLQKLKNIPLF